MRKLLEYIDLLRRKNSRAKWVMALLAVIVFAQIGLGVWGITREYDSVSQKWIETLPAQAETYTKDGCFDFAAITYRTYLGYYPDDPETLTKFAALQKDMDARWANLSQVKTLDALKKSSACTFVATPLEDPLNPGTPDFLPYIWTLASAGVMLIFWLLLVFQLRLPPTPQVKTLPDPLDIMIGSKHGNDILGEFYEVAYQTQNASKKYSQEYLVGMQEEILRRFIENYRLNPIGEPGEGPIPFDPSRHRPYGRIDEKTPVYILSIGWEQDGQIVLPALVSTEPKNVDKPNRSGRK